MGPRKKRSYWLEWRWITAGPKKWGGSLNMEQAFNFRHSSPRIPGLQRHPFNKCWVSLMGHSKGYCKEDPLWPILADSTRSLLVNSSLWGSHTSTLSGFLTCRNGGGTAGLVLASVDVVVHMSNRNPNTQICKEAEPRYPLTAGAYFPGPIAGSTGSRAWGLTLGAHPLSVLNGCPLHS